MASVFDVAAFILMENNGWMEALKLQKLVYYSHAWSLVWDGCPLFPERIEAWKRGPVVRELWASHRDQDFVYSLPVGRPDALDLRAAATVRAVVNFYGRRPSGWLVELTHREAPWRAARGGLPPEAPSNEEITPGSMLGYFGTMGIGKGELSEALMRGLDLLVNTPIEDLSGLLSAECLDGQGLEKWLSLGEENPWASS